MYKNGKKRWAVVGPAVLVMFSASVLTNAAFAEDPQCQALRNAKQGLEKGRQDLVNKGPTPANIVGLAALDSNIGTINILLREHRCR